MDVGNYHPNNWLQITAHECGECIVSTAKLLLSLLLSLSHCYDQWLNKLSYAETS